MGGGAQAAPPADGGRAAADPPYGDHRYRTAVVGTTADRCHSFYMKFPARCVFVGSSSSGKSTLALRLVQQLDYVSGEECPEIARFILCYQYYQPMYEQLIEAVRRRNPDAEILSFEGYPEERFGRADFWQLSGGGGGDRMTFLFLDDVENGVGRSFLDLFQGRSHHARVNVFFLHQDHTTSPPLVKRALRNTDYFFITRSSFNGILLRNLNTRIFPYNPRFLQGIYDWILQNVDHAGYPYMLICLPPSTEPAYTVRTGILKDQQPIMFIPVTN
jgi:hypothetical protein